MPRAATVRSKMPAERSLAASARLRVKRASRRRCQWAMRSPVLASYSFSAARKTEIGRASCRERVEISVVAVSLKKKQENLGFDGDSVVAAQRVTMAVYHVIPIS